MNRIAIVEGVRTPFCKAGTLFNDLSAVDLGRTVTRELLERTAIDYNLIDEVIFGCVAQPAEAANISRVIALSAGLPLNIPSYTVHRNCASGIESVTSAYEKITSGYAKVVIAGGTESMSNIPLLFPKRFAEFLVKLNKAKTPWQRLKVLSGFRFGLLKPRIGLLLGLTDPVCGLNMGQTAEVLAKEFGITRREQDEFALKSHRRAIQAKERLKQEIVPVIAGKKYNLIVEEDNGPRQDTSLDTLAKLKPYFDKYTGTVTVGNSCQVTDGACAVLVMTEQKAKELDYKPLGYIRAYAYVGVEPQRMGLGPSFAIPTVLKRAGLTLKDIQLFEINEAFAVQVLAVLRVLEQSGVGSIPYDLLNVNGGAIALGHPVGVTGTRLILTLLKEMQRRNLNLGLVSLCVGGGQGAAIILER